MDIDILKPDTGKMHIERPTHVGSGSTSAWPSGAATPEPESRPYAEPVSEGEEDEMMLYAAAKDEDKRTGLTGQAVADAIAAREKMLEESRAQSKQKKDTKKAQREEQGDVQAGGVDGEESEDDENETSPLLRRGNERSTVPPLLKNRAMSIDPLAPSQVFDETLKNKLAETRKARREERMHNEGEDGDAEDEIDEDHLRPAVRQRDDRELVRYWRAEPGKRISVPVRIEPKVFFASERTFLVSGSPCASWTKLIDAYSAGFNSEFSLALFQLHF